MSVRATPASASVSGPERYPDDDRGAGWVTLAGVLLLILGAINAIEGIAAIGNAHFYFRGVNYVAGDLNA